MSQAYLALVRSGYVSSQKRDVMLEASRDLEYINNAPRRFVEASVDAAEDWLGCSVLLISELIEMGFCSLATWETGFGSATKVTERTRAELAVLLLECCDGKHDFEYFLLTTPLGDEWVRRYLDLAGELDVPIDALGVAKA